MSEVTLASGSGLPVRLAFEPGHVGAACLAGAYARLVPLPRRAVRPGDPPRPETVQGDRRAAAAPGGAR